MLGNRLQCRRSLGSSRRRGGFTLVEVLVVVGVLVVLAAITVPVVSKARQQAARTKCANILRHLGQAVIAFEAEHNGTLPTCGSKQPSVSNSTDWIGYGGIDTRTVGATTLNTDYMNESGLAKYLGTTSYDQNGIANEKLRNNYRCPSVSEDLRSSKPFPYDYQFNAQLSGMPIDRVDKSGTKGMIVESDSRDDSAYCYWSSGSYPNGTTSGQDTIAVNHGGTGGNCLFADCHVEFMDKNRENESSPAGNSDFQYWDARSPATIPPTPPDAFQARNASYGNAR